MEWLGTTNTRTLPKILVAGFLFSLHVALTIFIHSSFLNQVFDEQFVGILYTCSAIVSLIGLQILPRFIRKFTASHAIGALLVINICMLLGMIYFSLPFLIALCFIVYFAGNTLIYLGIDILLEHWSDQGHIGKIRGAYLTMVSIGFMIAPMITGKIVNNFGFERLYTVALVFLVPVFLIIQYMIPLFKNPKPIDIDFIKNVSDFFRNKNLARIYGVAFALQFFYAIMVIYSPIYLQGHLGISWDIIGIMFTAMLSAFVITQYAFGKIADTSTGEKPMLIIGLVLMSLCALLFSFSEYVSIIAITGLLFSSRIGASAVETMSESYFFKQVNDSHVEHIALYRTAYPLAYIIGPLVASALLGTILLHHLFIILGILLLLVLIPASYIENKTYLFFK